MNGHPVASKIKKYELIQERHDISSVVESHSDHMAIKTAILWLRSWLHDASLGCAAVACDDFRRLHDKQVSAESILIEAASVWLYFKRKSHQLDDGQQLTVGIGSAVLHLVPRDRRITGINTVGSYGYKNITAKTRGSSPNRVGRLPYG